VVILVDFSDTKGRFSRDFVQDLLFVKANSYYREVSYNQTWIVGDTTQRWYELPGTSSSYEWSKSTPYGSWEHFRGFVQTVVALADNDVDYSKYRYIVIVHSGKWRMNWGFVDPFTVTTKKGMLTVNIPIISAYQPLGVFAHELAHVFGYLPDMYDANYEATYVGQWDLMSSTTYCQHVSAWSKMKVGWIQSRAVATVSRGWAATATIDPLELPTSGTHAAMIPLDPDACYLVEVRQRLGFDSTLPDYGVLIYLVDETENEWGKSPIVVQDANPSTSTLDDAAFDLRDGKQAAFFDRNRDLSIVIIHKSGLSYTVFVGSVSQGEIALKDSERAMNAIKIIQDANASITRAIWDGRTAAIEKARLLLANATAAYEKRTYEDVMTLARLAKETADASDYPRVYYDAKELLTRAKDLRSSTAYQIASPEAIGLIDQGRKAYDLAEKAFSSKDYATAANSAREAIALFEKGLSADQAYRQQTITYFVVIGSVIAVGLLAFRLSRRKARETG